MRDADILVLIIGGRYGSAADESAKSVTNLEYLAARQKGIPVYAFVDQGILTLVPVWRANPTADFKAEVDNPNLFEFIEQVRTVDKVWTQEFKHSSDIINALRIQFAYQHRFGLLLQGRLRQIGDDHWLASLRGETLRIALEKPAGWEYRLFAHALIDGVHGHHRSRRRHETGIPLGLGEDVQDPLTWLRARFGDAMRMSQGLSTLLNTTLQEGLGPEGVPGNAEKIVFVAETIADVYADALQWSARIRAANMDEHFTQLRSIVSRMLDDLIRQVREFGPDAKSTFEAALAAPKTGTSRIVTMTLTISVSESLMDEFNREIARLRAELAEAG